MWSEPVLRQRYQRLLTIAWRYRDSFNPRDREALEIDRQDYYSTTGRGAWDRGPS